MSFRINTNIAAMNAHANAVGNNRDLSGSLGKLSSGLRIQTAADDASGMTIADSLRSQANALGQSIKNGNDAIGIVQTADKAMDEQIKILDTIKTKAIQAAQDGQNSDSRRALQNDITRLLEELDNIANTTAFNGQQLLNGSFSNKNFQIGAYSNETAKVSIGATGSNTIGHTRFETSQNVVYTKGMALSANAGGVTITLKGIDGMPGGDYKFQTISSGVFASQGLAAVADQINAVADKTGVKASVNNTQLFNGTNGVGIQSASVTDLTINGVKIGNISVQNKDADNVLIAAINKVKDQTGVEASKENGKLTLASKDGRTIHIGGSGLSRIGITQAKGGGNTSFMGQISFTRQDARDIVMTISATGGTTATNGLSGAAANSRIRQASVSLKTINDSVISSTVAAAMGFFNAGETATDQRGSGGVNTYAGAQAMINVAESARKTLDSIRSDLGSVQNQLVSTINNITVTQVNVKSAESQIRDVDFAEESANFSKFNILAQSGSYAMSQANAAQQNVLRLLQ
ncbi:flagellin B [Campylobacter fetus]|uniref:flagellin B n=2 Tax=Campylobacter fetus TaxID=196 RepID=UPI0003C257D4|nr:flagellin B [Campylobacter fetus]AGZ82430.1 flagellin [Campylobacter fetus subsp. testudinum 03-427]AJB46152.1 flagellin B [Campylobacter fetus subsp. testudinum]EAI4322777.1 flagellin B [Campylobacter fetus]EAI4392022.1 flagellin B [Campylobacter fetus]MPB72233.1 flagellin B [Campylobacter fetus]